MELVRRLDAIRLERAIVQPPVGLLGALIAPVTDDPKGPRGESISVRHYAEEFDKAGIGKPGDDPVAIAAKIQASPVRAMLVSALDDWSACAADRNQQDWILAVVRRADPDTWRDRVRDPTTWDDVEALCDLADHAPVAGQSPHLLAVLGARLRACNQNAKAFMARVASTYPADFWVNIEMGNELHQENNWLEAIGFYRTALALRPQTLSLCYALGDEYLNLKRWDEAIAEYEQAVRLAPDNAWCHNRLGSALTWKGDRNEEAIAHTREAVHLDPNDGWFHYCLGFALDRANRLEEAEAELQEAVRLLPEKRTEWMRDLRWSLLRRGRFAETRTVWNEELAKHPQEHDAWFGYAELCLFLRDDAEYRRARRDLLAQFGTVTEPLVADRVARACLLLPASDEELQQATALSERALAGGRGRQESGNPYFLFTQGLARYRQGRFEDAIKLMNGEAASVLGPGPRLVLAMAQSKSGQKNEARETLAAALKSYDWNPAKATIPDAWLIHVLRREAEATILHDAAESPDEK